MSRIPNHNIDELEKRSDTSLRTRTIVKCLNP